MHFVLPSFRLVTSYLLDRIMKNAFEYEAELAELREELAESGRADYLRQRIAFLTMEVHKLVDALAAAEQRNAELAAAEQRNAELVELLRMAWGSGDISAFDCRRIDAALKPTESGASE